MFKTTHYLTLSISGISFISSSMKFFFFFVIPEMTKFIVSTSSLTAGTFLCSSDDASRNTFLLQNCS